MFAELSHLLLQRESRGWKHQEGARDTWSHYHPSGSKEDMQIDEKYGIFDFLGLFLFGKELSIFMLHSSISSLKQS